MNKDIIEILAEIEHEQWVEWSKALVKSEVRLSMNRIERWKKLWKPYVELTEEEKDQDRVYARKVLLHVSDGLCKMFDHFESVDVDKSTEQWKNYKFIRNNIRDFLKQ